MVVYADILIILNFAVDYFLLRAAAFLQHLNPPLWRILLSAAAGGISSLYIFLPPRGVILDILFRTAVCAAMTFICFGFGKIKRFLRSLGVFLLVTFGYGGIYVFANRLNIGTFGNISEYRKCGGGLQKRIPRAQGYSYRYALCILGRGSGGALCRKA